MPRVESSETSVDSRRHRLENHVVTFAVSKNKLKLLHIFPGYDNKGIFYLMTFVIDRHLSSILLVAFVEAEKASFFALPLPLKKDSFHLPPLVVNLFSGVKFPPQNSMKCFVK